ncbi:hypothetical protein GJ744_006167 [Endocarpon pusillum]|uniref:non-specific serine/threonine protein kinase n=1 Tax=Endocarpon pusillum TaxID=364733 RepID=A0A8H7DZA7_9EURO|nr:hypothetical protein GJ744_006167 [Endocarpon pusillum]
MWKLVDALLWLHEQLTVKDRPGLCCAHMDFKPENILIHEDADSQVGRWMITDLGIFVFKKLNLEDDDAEKKVDPGVKTVGDLGIKLMTLKTQTINAQVKQEGTYQPPEAHRSGSRHVGRKSDMWSFACVLMVVLTFALGGAKLCDEFREERARGQKADYFYLEKKGVKKGMENDLKPSEITLYLSANKEVETRLYRQAEKHQTEAHWLRQCADLVAQMLRIEPKERLSAKQANSKLQSIYELSKGEQAALPSFTTCASNLETGGLIRKLDHSPDISISTVELSKPFPSAPTLTLSRSLEPTTPIPTHLGRMIHNRTSSIESNGVVTPSNVAGIRVDEPRTSNEQDHIHQSPQSLSDRTSEASQECHSSEIGTPRYYPSFSSPLSRYSSVNWLPGSTSSPSKHVCDVPRLGIELYSLSQDGKFACFIYDHRVRVCGVADGLECASFMIPSDVRWKGVRMSGCYLAMYGIKKKTRKKSIFLYDLSSSREVDLPSTICVKDISGVLVSKKGLFGFVVDNSVHLLHVRTRATPILMVESNYSIMKDNANFGSDGEWLSVWATPRTKDKPHLCYFGQMVSSEDGRLVLHVRRGTYRHGDLSIAKFDLFPFRSEPACIIRKINDNTFFIVRETLEPETCEKVKIQQGKQAVILHDESLICLVRTRTKKAERVILSKNVEPQALEYPLSGDPGDYRRIRSESFLFGKLLSDIQEKTLIAALEHEDAIVLCSLKEREVEIQRISRTSRE